MSKSPPDTVKLTLFVSVEAVCRLDALAAAMGQRPEGFCRAGRFTRQDAFRAAFGAGMFKLEEEERAAGRLGVVNAPIAPAVPAAPAPIAASVSAPALAKPPAAPAASVATAPVAPVVASGRWSRWEHLNTVVTTSPEEEELKHLCYRARCDAGQSFPVARKEDTFETKALYEELHALQKIAGAMDCDGYTMEQRAAAYGRRLGPLMREIDVSKEWRVAPEKWAARQKALTLTPAASPDPAAAAHVSPSPAFELERRAAYTSLLDRLRRNHDFILSALTAFETMTDEEYEETGVAALEKRGIFNGMDAESQAPRKLAWLRAKADELRAAWVSGEAPPEWNVVSDPPGTWMPGAVRLNADEQAAADEMEEARLALGRALGQEENEARVGKIEREMTTLTGKMMGAMAAARRREAADAKDAAWWELPAEPHPLAAGASE